MTISKKTSSSPAPVRPSTAVTKSLLASKVKPVIPLKTKHELILQEKDKVSSTAAESEEESSTSGSTSDSETEGESTSETSSSECNTDENLSPRSLPLRHLTTRAGFQTPKPVSANSSDQIVKDHEKKLRKEKPWTICLTHCRYEIVRTVAKRHDLAEVNQDEAWNIYWTDYSVSIERALDMRRFQIINHFPGMNEICRKDLLARNLNRMKKIFPSDYKFFPKTWSLPTDLGQLQEYASTRKNKIYICKPEMGCQGRGIFLIRNIKDLNPFGKIVCQLYLAKPFLIDGYKFDLRIYALITSCDPLRVYVYKEGLGRFATAKYKAPTNNNNTENSYMHLTNYAVNKFSRDYVVDDESGSKRKLTAVYKWLSEQGHNTEKIIAEVDEVIVKTILSAQPILKQNYNYCFPDRNTMSACFEILGFDIIFDHRLKPYVLEVNHSPSFHTDFQLDLQIKEGLLQDTFAMLNFKQLNPAGTKSSLQKDKGAGDLKGEENDSSFGIEAQTRYEIENCGDFRLIYPSQGSEKYDQYFEQNWHAILQERIAISTARANARKNINPSKSNPKSQEDKEKPVTAVNPSSQKVEEEKEKEKEKIVPEAKPVPSKKPLPERAQQQDSFHVNWINPAEELERTKAIMQRGLLVRSLGIEIQVYKLLRAMGCVKPEEDKLYQHLYAHCLNNQEHNFHFPKG